MSNEQATKRPWVVESDGESPVITFEARNIAVVESYYGDGDANAALIVRAVNSHDKLVEVCEKFLDWADGKTGSISSSQRLAVAEATARAALALAKGDVKA
jgi:hypothetical protein